MNCKKIRDFIITDYLDNEINERLFGKIRDHLNVCSKCKQFENDLRETTVQPFSKLEIMHPDESVWLNIKKNVKQEYIPQKDNLLGELINKLSLLFSIKRSIYPAVGIAVIFLAITLIFFIKNPINNEKVADNRKMVNRHVSEYLNEQIEFLVELDLFKDGNLDSDNISFNTSIEKYFF